MDEDATFPMVIWPEFRMGQYRVNDNPYHALYFSASTSIIKKSIIKQYIATGSMISFSFAQS